MVKSSSTTILLSIAAISTLVAVFLPSAVTAITCNDVKADVNPCMGYLISGQKPSDECCQDIAKLNNQAVDTASRRTVCNCLKNYARLADGNQNITARAQALPGLCHINLPYPISSTVDCNSVN